MLSGVCGRFVQTTPPERLRRALEQLTGAPVAVEGDLAPWTPRWNVAPRSPVVACRVGGGPASPSSPLLGRLRWGLVPSSARDASRAPAPHNLRIETVLGRPAWRRLAERRRAVVPADAFYEWREGRPSAFARALGGEVDAARRPLLWLAALWDLPRDDASTPGSVAILTQPAGEVVGAVHDRQPVCLPDALVSPWLEPAPPDGGALSELLWAIVRAQDDVPLERWPVARTVNRVGAEGPELLAPVPGEGVSPR